MIDAGHVRRHGRVDMEAYNALVAGLDRLVDEFAQALRELSRHAGPVIMFIDTGELLGQGLKRLRVAMDQSGPRVVWVLGSRLEREQDERLESAAARFRRALRKDRLWPMQLRHFDDPMIEEYLRRRLGKEYPARLDIKAVARRTHGIPLAVFLVSRLLADGQDVASVLAPVRDGEVSSMYLDLAERYLVHVNDSPALRPDLVLLYGLALLYGEGDRSGLPADPSGRSWLDPDALAALWDVPAREVAACLDGLAARHDFVSSRSYLLHQEVREAVLLLLLAPAKRSEILDLSTRAAALYRNRANDLRHLTVDAQIADQGWRSAAISLLWHTFWIDLGQGLRMLQGLFAAAVMTDVGFAAALLRAAAFFAPICMTDHRRLISDLQVVSDLQLVFRPSRARLARAAPSVREVTRALATFPAEPLLAMTPPLAAYHDLFQASCHETLGLTAPDRAALLLRAASDVEPGGPTARVITSQARDLVIGVGDYLSALPDTQQAVVSALGLLARFDPGDALAHSNHASILFDLGRYQEAETAYREAVRLDPGNATNHNNLGATLSGLGRHDEAETAYREALRLDSGNVTYHGNLARMLLDLGRHDEAETAYREAVRLDPGNATNHNNLGTALFAQGRHDEAETAYREALRLDPGNATYHNNLGNMQFDLGRHDEAETAYREAARLDSGNATYHNNLATTLSGQAKHDAAEAAYREALRLDSGNADVHDNLGSMLFEVGRHDEAETSYREAVRLDPDNAGYRSNLGGVLAYLGRYDETEAAYRDALRLDPGSADAYNGLGYALVCLGRYAEAEAAYHEAARLNPGFTNPHSSLGRLYLKILGRVDDAEEALREALRLDPGNESAHASLGSLGVIAGDLDAARSSFLQATQSAPAKHAFSELMLGALDCDADPSGAAEHFTAALAVLAALGQPTFMTPFERAEIQALAMAALGRGQAAAEVLERAVSKRSGADVFQRQHYELFGRSGLAANIRALTGIWRDIIARDESAAGPWGAPGTLPAGEHEQTATKTYLPSNVPSSKQ